MEVTKSLKFEAAHRLEDWDWSPCYRVHGHSWEVQVTLSKMLSTDGEFVVDYSSLGKILKQYVHEKLDHQYLNDVLNTRNATSEFLAIWIWRRIQDAIEGHHQFSTEFDGVKLVRVMVRETDTAYCEYYGEMEPDQ